MKKPLLCLILVFALLSSLFCTVSFASAGPVKKATYKKINFEYTLVTGSNGVKTAKIVKAIFPCDSRVILPDNLDGYIVTHIGEEAIIHEKSTSLYRLPNTDPVTIPDSITHIERKAFSRTSNEELIIPDGVIYIGDEAFGENRSLKRVIIPSSVTSIEGNPFALCPNFFDISLSPNNKTFALIDGILYHKAEKKLVCCPAGMPITEVNIPQGILAIGDKAFYYCESLKEVTIPDSVTQIGDDAFYWCKSLKEVTIPDGVTQIGDDVFHCCDSLTEINIPSSVTHIGENAFYLCDSLTEINIPSSVTHIGENAFCLCESLTKISIPDSVTYIGDKAFWSCQSLEEVIIPSSVISFGGNPFYICNSVTPHFNLDEQIFETIDGMLYNKVEKSLLGGPKPTEMYEYHIPQGTISIYERAFYNFKSLKEVTIPDSVTHIGDEAFQKHMTLIVGHDSYAEVWAKENEIPYKFADSDIPDWLNS